MDDYPAAISTFRAKANLPNQPYDEDKQTTVFVEDFGRLESELQSVEEVIGTDPLDGHDSLKDRISDLEAVVSALDEARKTPIGGLYFSTNSTNPATSLGYGTWSAFGTGKMFVGFDSGQTEFDTDEETGGAKTVTLTTGEIPAHTHGNKSLTGAAYFHGASSATVLTTNVSGILSGQSLRTSYRSGGSNIGGANSYDGFAVDASHEHTSVGGGGSHNNLPPYIVIRAWKRTA